MSDIQSTFEWMQYGHWISFARKARFSAFVIWQMRDESKLNELIEKCKYDHGDADHALSLAFRRESSIALELVIKAVIARNLENSGADPSEKTGRVPTNHDLPNLWRTAKLPKLLAMDQERLLLGKSVLMWSGRYATPTSDNAWVEENKEFDRLRELTEPKKKFRKPTTMDWSDFDRLFQMAEAALST